jgi:hypothetical protein
MLTYDTPALRLTGCRNLMGQKTLPTIWGTYMKLVTKYQISAINFFTGQNTVWYDQVYDLLPVSTLYATIKFMICYWSEHCTVWPSLWFVTGQYTVCYDHFSLWFVTGHQSTVCYDQVYDLLLARMLYVTTKFMICYWSENYMLRPSLWFVTGQNAKLGHTIQCSDQ